jgi:hypothetical protein
MFRICAVPVLDRPFLARLLSTAGTRAPIGAVAVSPRSFDKRAWHLIDW